MVLNLRDWQQTPAAPVLESQKVEEGGEHDFNILGNGQKEDLEEEKPHRALPRGQVHGARGKGQNAARLQSAAGWGTLQLCVDYRDRN